MSLVQKFFLSLYSAIFTNRKCTSKNAKSCPEGILLGDRFCRDLLFVLIYPLHGVDALLLLQPLDELAVEDRSLNVLQRKLEKVCLQGNERMVKISSITL